MFAAVILCAISPRIGLTSLISSYVGESIQAKVPPISDWIRNFERRFLIGLKEINFNPPIRFQSIFGLRVRAQAI